MVISGNQFRLFLLFLVISMSTTQVFAQRFSIDQAGITSGGGISKSSRFSLAGQAGASVHGTASGARFTITNESIEFDVGPVASVETPDSDLPLVTVLHGAFPNPFNPRTNISLSLPADSPVVISIYNISGRKIRVIEFDNLPAGHHNIVWNGRNDSGGQVASGVYLVTMSATAYSSATKVTLLK